MMDVEVDEWFIHTSERGMAMSENHSEQVVESANESILGLVRDGIINASIGGQVLTYEQTKDGLERGLVMSLTIIDMEKARMRLQES